MTTVQTPQRNEFCVADDTRRQPKTRSSSAAYPARCELTGAEHLAEIGEILAIGLQRALARKSSRVSADTGESSLHLPPDQSGHPTPEDRRKSDA